MATHDDLGIAKGLDIIGLVDGTWEVALLIARFSFEVFYSLYNTDSRSSDLSSPTSSKLSHSKLTDDAATCHLYNSH